MDRKFELAIFDWDGTLMDTIGKIVSCMQTMAHDLNLTVPSEQAVRDVIGLSLPAIMPILFSGKEQQHNRIIDAYRTYHQQSHLPTPLFDGSEQLIKDLHAQGYQLAVATGKARDGLDRVLTTTGLAQYFSVTRSASEAKSKPHPEMIQSILTELNIPAHQAVMIGDSRHDLTMANNANVSGIGVNYGAHSDKVLSQCNPIAIVDSPLAIKHHL